jgi:undecaprenyl diphosphate synthase
MSAPTLTAVSVDLPQPVKTEARKPQICVPRHIAMVPDETQADAQAWVSALSDLIDVCVAEGVADLSVLVWNGRSLDANVAARLESLRNWLRSNAARLGSRGVKIAVLGKEYEGSAELLDALRHMTQTSARPTLTLNLAVNYNGREELAGAVQILTREAISSNTSVESIGIEKLSGHLLSRALPPVDLLVRTGGHTRLSDFLLWQAAYAELLFMEKAWAKMRGEDFLQALSDYARRRRTFGGLSA